MEIVNHLKTLSIENYILGVFNKVLKDGGYV